VSVLRWPAPILNHESYLKKLLLALMLLNLGDMLFTLWGVQAGVFIEANPLMRWCMNRGTVFFVVVKSLLCVQFVLGSLLIAKRFKHLTFLISIIVFFYSAVVLWSVGLLI